MASASACSTKNSATATSFRSKATSSSSLLTRRARSAWSTRLSSGRDIPPPQGEDGSSRSEEPGGTVPHKTIVARLRTDERTARRLADLFAECFDPEETASAAYEADGGWTVALYSARPFDRDALHRMIAGAAGETAGRAVTFETIAENDWGAEHPAGLKPIGVSGFFLRGSP